jgi:hypothetical protein
MYIYNRWGEINFESHDASIGWEGTYGNAYVLNKLFCTTYKKGF